MASEFPDAGGAPPAAVPPEDNARTRLEKDYARLNEALFRCDGLIPQEGLQIWGGDDRKGKRIVRAALGVEDITRTPEDFADDIRDCQTSVLDRERFPIKEKGAV